MTLSQSAETEIAALGDLDLEGLRSVWRERFGAPPALRSPQLLALMLAWRIQAKASGGLDADMRRMLLRAHAPRSIPEPSSGTRMVREWQGVRHEVVVLNDGSFAYRGAPYRSLSQIARLITGSRWNGPRFFGLRAIEAAA